MRTRSAADFVRRSRSAAGSEDRDVLEGAEVAALFGRLRGELRDLRTHALRDDFRQKNVGLHAFTHQRDVLVHVGRECVETRQPVVEVFHRLEAQRIDDELRALHAAERRRANQVLPMLKAFHDHLILMPEDVVIEPVGGRERIARDGGEILQHRLAVGLAGRQRTRADVLPTIVPAAVAEVGRPQRILRELPLPLAVEKRVQRGGGGVRWLLCMRHRREQHASEHEAVFPLHSDRV